MSSLDKEEQDILDAFECGEFKTSAFAADEMNVAQEAARNTFNKSKRVNLRLTEQDFERAHIKALKEGLPYQTLLASIIHKYLTGRLVDKTSA